MPYTMHCSNLWHLLRPRTKQDFVEKSENNELGMVKALLQLIKTIIPQDMWQLQLIKPILVTLS